MTTNRMAAYRAAHSSPVATLVRRIEKAADELEELAGVAADLVPGSPLAEWAGEESAERLVGHLKALMWVCRSASASIAGEM